MDGAAPEARGQASENPQVLACESKCALKPEGGHIKGGPRGWRGPLKTLATAGLPSVGALCDLKVYYKHMDKDL